MSISRREFNRGLAGGLVGEGLYAKSEQEAEQAKETETQKKDTALLLSALKAYWGEDYEAKSKKYFGEERQNIFTGGKLIYLDDPKFLVEARKIQENLGGGTSLLAESGVTDIRDIDFIQSSDGHYYLKKSLKGVLPVVYYILRDDRYNWQKTVVSGKFPKNLYQKEVDACLVFVDLVKMLAEKNIQKMTQDSVALGSGKKNKSVLFEGREFKSVSDFLKRLKMVDMVNAIKLPDGNMCYLPKSGQTKIYGEIDSLLRLSGIIDPKSQGLEDPGMDPRLKNNIAVMLVNYQVGKRNESVKILGEIIKYSDNASRHRVDYKVYTSEDEKSKRK